VVLLDPCALVIHVERGIHALGDDPCPKPTRGGFGSLSHDSPLEDQLDLIGSADVEVFADDLLEEDAPGHRAVQDLSEGELRLKYRQLVSDTRRAVLGLEGMGNTTKPLPK
jgi:hypothetical protein